MCHTSLTYNRHANFHSDMTCHGIIYFYYNGLPALDGWARCWRNWFLNNTCKPTVTTGGSLLNTKILVRAAFTCSNSDCLDPYLYLKKLNCCWKKSGLEINLFISMIDHKLIVIFTHRHNDYCRFLNFIEFDLGFFEETMKAARHPPRVPAASRSLWGEQEDSLCEFSCVSGQDGDISTRRHVCKPASRHGRFWWSQSAGLKVRTGRRNSPMKASTTALKRNRKLHLLKMSNRNMLLRSFMSSGKRHFMFLQLEKKYCQLKISRLFSFFYFARTKKKTKAVA